MSYKACFHDQPWGLETHIYAPTGLDIREKWSIQGTLPGERPEPRELGSTAPAEGLYLKEECEMRCNRLLNSFVRKNLDEAHKVLVERIMRKAQLIEQHRHTMQGRTSTMSSMQEYINNNIPETAHGNGFQVGSHMSHSRVLQSPTIQSPPAISPLDQRQQPQIGQYYNLNDRYTQSPQSPQSHNGPPNLADHPAFRTSDPTTYNQGSSAHNRSWSTNDSTTIPHTGASKLTIQTQQSSLDGSSVPRPPHYQHASMSAATGQRTPATAKQFVAELPGSIPPAPRPYVHLSDRRESILSDMSSDLAPGGTDRASMVSDLDLTVSPIDGKSLPQLPQTTYQYNPMDFQRR